MLRKYSVLQLFILGLSLSLAGHTEQLLFTAKAYAYPDTICQGQHSQLLVIIQGGPGSYTYLWSPAATLSNPAISNPVATPLVNTMYHVVVQDQWLNSSTDSIMVYVQTNPLPPSQIYGPANVCADTICDYYINPVEGATSYSWTVPSGAIIKSGQNTPAIHLEWGSVSGTVSVIITNNCGAGVPGVLAVNVTSVPSVPQEIDGPSHICPYDTGYYFTDPVPYAVNYNWIIPGDAVILSGEGTTSVRIKWGMRDGNIGVGAENSCGAGPSITKTVVLDSLPASADAIDGPDTVCIGKGGYNYFITPLKFATTYGWTLPQGAFIVSGELTNSITVDFGMNATSGPITVFGINDCGNGLASSEQIVTRTCSGLDAFNTGSEITIAPNPVSEKILIHSKGHENHYEVIIVNQLGEIVYHTLLAIPGQGHFFEIDARRFPHGMIYLKMFNEDVSFTAKLMVL